MNPARESFSNWALKYQMDAELVFLKHHIHIFSPTAYIII